MGQTPGGLVGSEARAGAWVKEEWDASGAKNNSDVLSPRHEWVSSFLRARLKTSSKP